MFFTPSSILSLMAICQLSKQLKNAFLLWSRALSIASSAAPR